MDDTPEDYVAALRRIGADPALPVHALVHQLRMLGMRGGDRKLRQAVRQYRAPVTVREGWLTRSQAALRLNVSVQRVDQLRRSGVLVWERISRHQKVLISAESVDRYALDRARGNPGPSEG